LLSKEESVFLLAALKKNDWNLETLLELEDD
jgi:hypothetical protein